MKPAILEKSNNLILIALYKKLLDKSLKSTQKIKIEKMIKLLKSKDKIVRPKIKRLNKYSFQIKILNFKPFTFTDFQNKSRDTKECYFFDSSYCLDSLSFTQIYK